MNMHIPLLSLREIQVLRLAAEGLTAKATATALHLSESAVNLYLVHARQKLGAKTKAEAIAMWMESGSVISESIEHVKAAVRRNSSRQDDHLHEMVLLSNKMRRLLEDMLIADVTRNTENGDQAIWNDLAEKFLKTAAQACGFQVVKVQARSSASSLEVCGGAPAPRALVAD